MEKKRPTRVALIGPANGVNYGNALTYYALYQVLKESGHAPLIVLPPYNFWWGKNKGWTCWKKPPYDAASVAPHFATKQEIATYFEQQGWYDIYLVGSDQLFRPIFLEGIERYSFLDWVPDSRKKCVYAASFGSDRLVCYKKEWRDMRFWLRKFDAFSVREKSGVDICHDYFRIRAPWVPDPVFLCDRLHFDKLADVGTARSGGLVSYILDSCTEKTRIISGLAKALDMKVYDIKSSGAQEGTFCVEDWIQAIRHADYLATDSFHGACFAIIYHIPFTLISNHWRGAARHNSLLELTGLQNRMVYDYAPPKDLHLPAIDWDTVDARIARARTAAFSFLSTALTPEKAPVRPALRRLYDSVVLWAEDLLRPHHPEHVSKLRKLLMNLIPLPSLRRRWREKYIKTSPA